MSVMQNYGVLRVVCGNHGSRGKIAMLGRSEMRDNSIDQGLDEVLPLRSSMKKIKQRYKYLGRWLPEERLTHVLSQRETTIGRALSSDIILLDPTVSRDHARLVLGEDGWCVQNVTENNVVRVNGHVVEAGAWSPLQPQDLLVIGNTTLQLVAPLPGGESFAGVDVSLFKEASRDHLLEAPMGGDKPRPYDQRDLDGRGSTDGQGSSYDQKGSDGQGSSCDRGDEEESLRDRYLGERDGHVGTGVSLAYHGGSETGNPCPRLPLTPLGSEGQRRTPEIPTPEDEEEWGQALSLVSSVTMHFALKRLGNRPWRFFLVGGLLSIVVIAGVWLVLGSLNNLFGLAQDGSYRLMLALLVPLIPALGINLLVHFIDRYECEPWFLRLTAFFWGAIIAIPPALFVEGFIDGFVTHLWGLDSQVVLHAFLSGLGAGLTEETLKGLGLLLLFFFLRDKFDNVTDGIVYGALIGAGFAMVENFYYFSSNTNDVSALIVGRIVLGWLSHSTFTICFGVALGYIRHTRVRWRQTVVPWLGYLLAVSLHTIFDFVEVFVRDVVPTYGNSLTVARLAILAVVGNYIPLFLVQVGILFILIKSLMHEAAIIREFLPPEVAEGVVTVAEYALLPHSFARNRLEHRVLWRYGIRQWLLTRALYQTEIGLAFCSWHVSMLQYPPTDRWDEQNPMVYRKRIKRIRQEIAALEAKRTE